MMQWNLTKINNKDLQKFVTNYNNTLHTTMHQIPAKIHARDDPRVIKNARSKIKAQVVKLLAKNDRKFPKIRIGNMVKVARRMVGKWKKVHTFKKYNYMKQ
jgi:hypothetical protein